MTDRGGDLRRGRICLRRAVGFKKDRARPCLSAAVERPRDGLANQGLETDERLLASVIDGSVPTVELAEK